MDTGLKALGVLGLAVLLATVWQAKRQVATTTLKNAWQWLLAAGLLWAGVWFNTSSETIHDAGIADRLWYAIAVVMLCSPVAVLGARRPIVRVWTWFVLLPMLLVLGLPLAVGWSNGGDAPSSRLELELPATLTYMLVLVMGAGNYFGTRFSMSSLLYATSLLLVVVPMSAAIPSVALTPERARLWATVILAAAALSARLQVRRDRAIGNPLDRLWLDFRDWFGIVWAKRVQDRVNQVAAEEHWPVRLEMHGLVPSPSDPAAVAQAERAFRWILRRFVDPEWIDGRLPAEGEPAASPPPITND